MSTIYLAEYYVNRSLSFLTLLGNNFYFAYHHQPLTEPRHSRINDLQLNFNIIKNAHGLLIFVILGRSAFAKH